MEDPEITRRFAAADRPANRRAAAQRPARAPVRSPLIEERRRAAALRHRLGAPLAEKVRSRHESAGGAGRDAVPVGQAVVAIASLGGLVAAWIQASAWLGGAGLIGLGGAAVWALRRRAPVTSVVDDMRMFMRLDAVAVERLDRVIEATAAELPDKGLAQLVELKDTLAAIVALWEQPSSAEHFTVDDRLHVIQSIARYLPDLLEGYLRVPAAQRHAQVLSTGETAEALLQSQLALLNDDLRLRHAALTRGVGETLVSQQRFLKSKLERR